MTDPRLNKNPAVDNAHLRVSRAGFKVLVTAWFPPLRSGRPNP
ncbi:MAG TPA: hypothetical protein VII16_16105 [Actinomycetes bacterium]